MGTAGINGLKAPCCRNGQLPLRGLVKQVTGIEVRTSEHKILIGNYAKRVHFNGKW